MITIGFSTRQDNQKYIDYLIKTSGLKNVEVIQKVNNGSKSLSQVYNEIINESKNDIVVFCHDDLEFDTKDWGKRIIKHFEKSDFGVLGVAGTTEIPKSGMWWEDKRKMIGIVNHKHEGKKWESKYSKSWGDEINECCFVDGLFIAVNKKRIKVNFDESVKGFHFYDVYFSVKNFLQNVKIGTIYNVRITHLSIGQTNESWEENRKVFEEEYKESLPIKSNINLDYAIKDFKFLKKYNLKIVLSCGDDIEFVKKTIEKIYSFNLPNFDINLITNENNQEEIKKLESDKIKVFEGYFDNLIKNLSILKWEDNFVNETYDLIFFIDKNVEIINNIFSSICETYHKEKPTFGCAFTTSLNSDYSIFSTRLNLFMNQNNQFNMVIDGNGSFYNVLNGYKENKLGNLSDVFVTTYQNLITNDWFDIQYDTNLCYNDFTIKCTSKNQKCFCDTNALTTQTSYNNNEVFSQDMNKFLQKIMSDQKTQNLIQKING
jgi:hypothetical protein